MLTVRVGRVLTPAIPALVAVIVLSGCTNSSTSSVQDANTSAPSAPSASSDAGPTSSTELEVTPESLRLSADLPAAELAQKSSELEAEWFFAGATEDTVEASDEKRFDIWEQYNGDRDAVYRAMAEENAKSYATALLPDNWQENPVSAQFYEDAVGINAQYIEAALKRHSDNQPLIERTVTTSNAVELEAPEGQRIIQFERVTTNANSENNPESSATVTWTFDITDGTARIVNVAYLKH